MFRRVEGEPQLLLCLRTDFPSFCLNSASDDVDSARDPCPTYPDSGPSAHSTTASEDNQLCSWQQCSASTFRPWTHFGNSKTSRLRQCPPRFDERPHDSRRGHGAVTSGNSLDGHPVDGFTWTAYRRAAVASAVEAAPPPRSSPRREESPTTG